MKFAISLLKKFINFNKDYTTLELAKEITNLGFEVEAVTNPAEKYKNFIVAEIVEAEKHKESEKLTLCKVNTGTGIFNVVCGASNARAGIKVCLAKIGAIVPQNNMEIKKGIIRGATSEGMLCSQAELCLEGDTGGIIELESTAVVGTEFADYLKINDPIIEISITPNRGDGACVYGIARDLAAKKLGLLQPLPQSSLPSLPVLSVNLKEDLPLVYFAKGMLKNNFSHLQGDIKIYNNIWGSSGILPVDFVNLQMFNFGMPMHIYDASKIKGNICIRRSLEGEDFIPIKGEPFKLCEGLLVASDDEKILSLLGVMGDRRSKTEASTQEFILEAIYIPPEEVIKSSRATKIKSDSSYRFERGIDRTQNIILANTLNALAEKIDSIFVFEKKEEKKQINFKIINYKNRIGYSIETQKAQEILTNLGFEVTLKGDELLLKVPYFRHDVSNEDDICEELARIDGYENITPLPLSIKPVKNIDVDFEIKKVLSEEMIEVVTYSFFKSKMHSIFSSGREKVDVLNSITQDLETMRDSLIPNLLSAISTNEKKAYVNLKLFEVGTVFYGVKPEDQKTNVAGVFAGKSALQSFLQEQKDFTIWDAKQKMLEVLYKIWGISEGALTFKAFSNPALHTKQSFQVLLGKMQIAILGQIHPITLTEFDIKQKVFAFEIFISNLPPFNPKKKFIYKEDILPDITREIAIIIKKEIKFDEIANVIKKLKIASIKDVKVKDVFENVERIGEGLKSISICFTIKQEKETLTKEVIDGEIIGTVIKALNSSFEAKIRDGETAN